jgi:hypothetical protein
MVLDIRIEPHQVQGQALVADDSEIARGLDFLEGVAVNRWRKGIAAAGDDIDETAGVGANHF